MTTTPDASVTATEDRLLLEFVAAGDHASPRCGYSLRGLSGRNCSECGEQLKLAIALVEPRLASFLALVLAWGMGLGGAGLFGALAMLEAPSRWWASTAGILLRAMMLICLVGVLASLVLRRKIRRMSAASLWMLALASWAIVVALAVGLIASFDA